MAEFLSLSSSSFLTFSNMFKVQRKLTLEFSIPSYLRTKNDRISRDEVVRSIRDSLRESSDKIRCVQASSNGFSYRVSFKPGAEGVMEALLMKGLYLRRSFVFLSEAEPQFTVLTVSNLPFELPDDALSMFLTPYGVVKSVIRNKDTYGFENGDRRVLISLTKHVPSMIFLEPYIAYVKYKDQPRCCHHCNYWGHVSARCGLKRRCTRCSSGQHASIDCKEPFSMPPEFPIGASIGDVTVEHPLLVKQREEEMFLEGEDASSTHTLDLFGDIEDLDDQSDWPSLPETKSSVSPSSSPALFSESQAATDSEPPSEKLASAPHAPASKRVPFGASSVTSSGSPPPFQRGREAVSPSPGRHRFPLDDSLSDLSSPSFSNVLRGAGTKRGSVDVPLSSFIKLKKKQATGPSTRKKS